MISSNSSSLNLKFCAELETSDVVFGYIQTMSLRAYANKAIEEVQAWRTNSPTAKNYDSAWYDHFIKGLEQLAASAEDLDRFCKIYDELIHSEVDSGPQESSFSPSFEAIGQAIDKLRRRSPK